MNALRATFRSGRHHGATALAMIAGLCLHLLAPAASAQYPTTDDPRFNLPAGITDAGTAQLGVNLLVNLPKPEGFSSPATDLAFQGNHVFVGNYSGFLIYDISNPASPVLVSSVVCPGSQGDLSVYGHLLFMSVQATSGKIDCTLEPTATALTRFRGVRIFDISDIAHPVLVGGVQTCRGSITHTLVEAPQDPDNVYLYVSGGAGVRAAAEPPGGCNNNQATGENPSRWRIEVIKVPLANPSAAAIVSEPRLFRDVVTGAVNGLQNSPQTPQHPSGTVWSPVPNTDHCNDITVFPALNLAAGACAGNGLLIDISDPVNPVRLDAVADPIVSYWKSATFSNDGTKVIFTDEWGSGSGARCRTTDQLSWGANAIYEIVNNKLEFRSYYKIPVAQPTQENCAPAKGGLIPVPGRDILAQAWYQGGLSLMDFTDAYNPVEIGYFDRGPMSSTTFVAGGFWSVYWYNGALYGSELARGLDVFGLTPTANLSAAEIAEATLIRFERLNPQYQTRYIHEHIFTHGFEEP